MKRAIHERQVTRKLLFVLLLCMMALMPLKAHADEALSAVHLNAATTSKGFKPKSGNYVRITFGIRTGNNAYFRGNVNISLRILDSKGKAVYQKNQSCNAYSGDAASGTLKWNGKASSGNEAGVKSGKYVKAGKYTVQLLVNATDYYGVFHADSKTVSLKVSKSAPSGKKGIAKMKTIPILTGDPEVDYIAERMVKAAKVKSSMSQAEKVRRIYNWMTFNFKHVHDVYSNSYKVYYKTSKLRSKIQSYKLKTDEKYKKGELFYNYDDNYVHLWSMRHRAGTCTNHSAIFKILLNHVGIDAGICYGYYLNLNGTKARHYWNYAVVNGSVYYYDVDVELQNLKKISNHYYWYMKTKSQAKKNHKFKTDSSKTKYKFQIGDDDDL